MMGESTVLAGALDDPDVVVVGGGQAALAVGYYLRRAGLRFVLLDDQDAAGGAWRHAWPSLRLFSPPQWSSLPGWLMPRDTTAGDGDAYPTRDMALDYLTEYERRYAIPVRRPVHVDSVTRDGDRLRLGTSAGIVRARAVVSATGTWAKPLLPMLPGQESFAGDIVHSAHYAGPATYRGRSVVVVGGGNSGAQIIADLSAVARTTWATSHPPVFLPDEVDGRYLFEQATARFRALQEGRSPDPPRSLGDIVAVESVRAARARGALDALPMFTRYTSSGVVWGDAHEEPVDAVILATGFRPALDHLSPLRLTGSDGRVAIEPGGSGTRAVDEPRLWLVGYGDWTGFASATLVGVGRSARATVEEITSALGPVPAA